MAAVDPAVVPASYRAVPDGGTTGIVGATFAGGRVTIPGSTPCGGVTTPRGMPPGGVSALRPAGAASVGGEVVGGVDGAVVCASAATGTGAEQAETEQQTRG